MVRYHNEVISGILEVFAINERVQVYVYFNVLHCTLTYKTTAVYLFRSFSFLTLGLVFVLVALFLLLYVFIFHFSHFFPLRMRLQSVHTNNFRWFWFCTVVPVFIPLKLTQIKNFALAMNAFHMVVSIVNNHRI